MRLLAPVPWGWKPNGAGSVCSCPATRPRSAINALLLLSLSRTSLKVAAQPASRSGIRPINRARDRPAARTWQPRDDTQIHASRRSDDSPGDREGRRHPGGLRDGAWETHTAHRRRYRASPSPGEGIHGPGQERARPWGPGSSVRRQDLCPAAKGGRPSPPLLPRPRHAEEHCGGPSGFAGGEAKQEIGQEDPAATSCPGPVGTSSRAHGKRRTSIGTSPRRRKASGFSSNAGYFPPSDRSGSTTSPRPRSDAGSTEKAGPRRAVPITALAFSAGS